MGEILVQFSLSLENTYSDKSTEALRQQHKLLLIGAQEKLWVIQFQSIRWWAVVTIMLMGRIWINNSLIFFKKEILSLSFYSNKFLFIYHDHS